MAESIAIHGPRLYKGSPHNWISTVFDNSPVGILRVDTDLNIVYANRVMLGIAGLVDWQGKRIQDIVSDQRSLNLINAKFVNRLKGLTEEYEMEITRADDGKKIPVAVAAMPLLDSRGEVTGAVSIIRDTSLDKAIQSFDKRLKLCTTSADVLREIAVQAEKLIPYDYCAASIYSNDLKRVRAIFTYAAHADFQSHTRWYSLGEHHSELLEEREVSVINDLPEYFTQRGMEIQHNRTIVSFLEQGFRSVIRYPVFREGRLIASFTFSSREVGAFTSSHAQIVRSLPIDSALITALHYELTADLKFRFELLKEVVSCKSNRRLSGILVKRISAHYGWANVSIFDVDEFGKALRLNTQKSLSRRFSIPRNYTQPLDEGLLGHAYKLQQAVNVGNVSLDETFSKLFIRACPLTVSELCIPILVDGKITSILNVEDPQENAFSPEEVESLRVLLTEAGAAFERIRADNLHIAAFETTPSAVFFIDRAGLIQKANSAAYKLLGSRSPLEGSYLEDLFEDHALAQAFLAAENPVSREAKLLRKDKSVVTVLIGGSDLGAEFEGERLISARDLHGHIRSEETIFLNQLFYELATQYKTPLSLVFNWLQNLQSHVVEASVLDVLEKAILQLNKVELTFDRLALFDTSKATPQYSASLLRINNFLGSLIDEFPVAERRRIRVASGQDLDSVLVWGDAFQLSFVFKSILGYFLRSSSWEESVSIQCKTGMDGISFLISGPSTNLMSNMTGRRSSDRVLKRALWEMALAEEVIRQFVQNHDGAFGEELAEEGKRCFRINLPTASKERLP
jgi:PAS domain S-box-containing protein